MRSEAQRPIRTFATFRIVGDDLIPDQITKFLKLVPTQAYAKGERYAAGPHGAELRGRTGVWYLSTDRFVASDRLNDHLGFLLLALGGGSHANAQAPAQWLDKIDQLRHLLERKSLRAVVTCFWDGPAGAKPPIVPRNVANAFKLIPAEVETDFDTDDELPPRRHELAQA